jgi:GMP synthase (glutamine-hydrolysing)
VLIHEAIGEQLTCVFVDHGLREPARHGGRGFPRPLQHPARHVRARRPSVRAGGRDRPRASARRSALFIEFRGEARRIGGRDFLAQGTLYPDVIESVSFTGGPSHTIKSHHNVGGLPERMNMRLVEPLRELFKDEVRKLGRELGLPQASSAATFSGSGPRHPLPWRGHGRQARHPSAGGRDLPRRNPEGRPLRHDLAGLCGAPARPHGGVMGDARTYEQVCALRAVTSVDGMTADFHPFDMAFLGRVSNRIVNEVRGINRVTYDVTSKPPGTIEWDRSRGIDRGCGSGPRGANAGARGGGAHGCAGADAQRHARRDRGFSPADHRRTGRRGEPDVWARARSGAGRTTRPPA